MKILIIEDDAALRGELDVLLTEEFIDGICVSVLKWVRNLK